ncbi:MAG: DUF1552 domain-containing protein [Myxococcota bacterium]
MSGGKGLNRRSFLGGAGAMLALPFLESLGARPARAATGTTSPTRLMVYFVPNGMHMASFTPEAAGPDWEKTPILLPLERHRDEMHIITGLANMAGAPLSAAPHTHGTGTTLTCTPIAELEGGQVHNGVSMDQVAANAIGFNTRFPSLEVGTVSDAQQLGVCEEGFSCAYLESIAWSGPKSPLPKINDPQALFDRLFAGVDPRATERERATRRSRRKSVLDYALSEARVLRDRLAVVDRYRLDEYMDGVRELERKLDVVPKVCDVPGAPQAVLDFPTHVDLMADLMVLALKCDQTRIMTYMLQNGFSSYVYDFLGIDEGHHGLTHHGYDQALIDQVVTINIWELDQFGNFLDKMKAVDEGEGTLLDHTAVLFVSSMGDGYDHLNYDLPVILAGRANGALLPGRHTIHTDYRPVADLYLALLNVMGLDLATFGADGTTPLEGLGG